MAKVTITIEDGPDDKVGVKVSFYPAVEANEVTTHAQKLAKHMTEQLMELRDQEPISIARSDK